MQRIRWSLNKVGSRYVARAAAIISHLPLHSEVWPQFPATPPSQVTEIDVRDRYSVGIIDTIDRSPMSGDGWLPVDSLGVRM